MKILDEKEKKIIILDEGETIEIKTLFNNNVKIEVSCRDSALYVDDILDERIAQIKMEEQELAKLKQNHKKCTQDSLK